MTIVTLDGSFANAIILIILSGLVEFYTLEVRNFHMLEFCIKLFIPYFFPFTLQLLSIRSGNITENCGKRPKRRE